MGASPARQPFQPEGIAQRYLLVRCGEDPRLECMTALRLLFQLRDLLRQAGRLGTERLGRPARCRPILARVKFMSRLLTAFNLPPSIATLACTKRPIVRHSTTKPAQTWQMARPLSLRKSAIVL